MLHLCQQPVQNRAAACVGCSAELWPKQLLQLLHGGVVALRPVPQLVLQRARQHHKRVQLSTRLQHLLLLCLREAGCLQLMLQRLLAIIRQHLPQHISSRRSSSSRGLLLNGLLSSRKRQQLQLLLLALLVVVLTFVLLLLLLWAWLRLAACTGRRAFLGQASQQPAITAR